MLSSAQQVKTAYETEGMTPEQIAEDQDLDLAAVKAVLMNVSSQYRKDCGMEQVGRNDLNFTDDQLSRVNDVIYEMAIGAEDEHLRFKAAQYVRDDKKGRKEIAKNMAGQTINLIELNTQIVQARQLTRDRLNQMKQLTNKE